MSKHPFLILCGGDTAEADDLDSAMSAARTLWTESDTAGYVEIQHDDGRVVHVPGEWFA